MKQTLSVCAVCLVTGMLWFSLAHAQDAPPTTVSRNMALRWDTPALGEDNQPMATVDAEIVLLDATDTIVKTARTGAGVEEPGAQTFYLGEFLSDVPDGPYTLSVRLRGENGVWSDPATLAIENDNGKPQGPEKLRIVITIEFGG